MPNNLTKFMSLARFTFWHVLTTWSKSELKFIFMFSPKLSYIADVKSACYVFKHFKWWTSFVDCVHLWAAVMKQWLGEQNWKLCLFIKLTSISSVSPLLQISGICIFNRGGSLLCATIGELCKSVFSEIYSMMKTTFERQVCSWDLMFRSLMQTSLTWICCYVSFFSFKLWVCLDHIAVSVPLPNLGLKQFCGFPKWLWGCQSWPTFLCGCSKHWPRCHVDVKWPFICNL